MSHPVRSAGWAVVPSFVPNGPTSPVTLLSDDAGLTQLVGEPAVAWQTPWTEISQLQLTRVARGVVLFATIAGVRYSWRTTRRSAYDDVLATVLAHGGTTSHQRRRFGALVVAALVILGSLAGALGGWLHRPRVSNELTTTRAINLTLRDLPNGWSTSPPSALSYLFPPSTQVITPTPTTLAKPHSTWARISGLFQRCLGVSAARDRVYGAAGQMPNYQVSSPVYTSLTGDVVVASTTQYYRTTDMVTHDVAEMSRAHFATCFATSQAAILFSAAGVKLPTGNLATPWTPSTFLRGFVRAAVVPLTLTGTTPQYLVMMVAASGHVELTMGALVSSWPGARSEMNALASTLLARAEVPSSRAV